MAALVVATATEALPDTGLGYDAHAYWSAAQQSGDVYTRAPLERDAFLYSPLFLQLVWPLAHLPWLGFYVTWAALVAAAFLWLLRPLPWSLRVPALVACSLEVVTGNIYAFMAAAIVLGVTRGSPWLLLGLTKVAPGAVGVVWHGVRGDWRALRRGLVAGVALVGASWLLAPGLWRAWAHLLLESSSGGQVGATAGTAYVVEVAVGVAVVVFGGRTGRPWTLVVATLLLSPTFGINTLTLLAALPRLRQEQHRLTAGRASEAPLRRSAPSA
jgi:hypothetical protein